MMHSRTMLAIATAVQMLLSACELVDTVEVAVSGPHCGKYGVAPGLEKEDLYVFEHYFDWDRIDGMIAVLEPHERNHGPDILGALGVLYVRKAVSLSYDPDYFRRGIRLLHWSALCGNAVAVEILTGLYIEGVRGAERDIRESLGVEVNPELGACLKKAYEASRWDYEARRFSHTRLAGRVWGCGVRLEDFPE